MDPDGAGPTLPKTYAYATFGGVSGDGDACYQYDGFDRLASVATPGGGGSCTTGTGPPTTYLYDGLDRQRSRTAASATTAYHYDGWGATVTVEMPSGGNDTAYVLDAASQQKAVATQGLLGTTEYLADDGQGNITTATSTAAVAGCTARFDPFGSPLGGGSQANPCSSGSTNNTAFYRGGRIDKTTGDYQFGSRTYDPKKSAFLTADNYRAGGSGRNLSVGIDPLTRNTYSYVNGDPVNFVDPDGHWRVPETGWCIGKCGKGGKDGKGKGRDKQAPVGATGSLTGAAYSSPNQPESAVPKVTSAPAGQVEARDFFPEGSPLRKPTSDFFKGARSPGRADTSFDFEIVEHQDGTFRLRFFTPAKNDGFGKAFRNSARKARCCDRTRKPSSSNPARLEKPRRSGCVAGRTGSMARNRMTTAPPRMATDRTATSALAMVPVGRHQVSFPFRICLGQ
ncbi:MAG: RHS repeat-associated core domain-containing protein [Acidimicrobiia bacterium]